MSNTFEIPLFDSLAHPMPDGNWLSPKYQGKNRVIDLMQGMRASKVQWALAVGMGPKIGGYDEDEYASHIRSHSAQLFPVAYVDVAALRGESPARIKAYLCSLVEKGYVGIKLHPRFGEFVINEPILITIAKTAARMELAVMLCTYCWENSCRASANVGSAMLDLLHYMEGLPIILVHGGGVRLLEFIEIARAFPNVLLDLSLTLCKYPGSSLDMDLKFAFHQFDRRICVGSDGPEFTSQELRRRFELFANDISQEKARNIAYHNLASFVPKVTQQVMTQAEEASATSSI